MSEKETACLRDITETDIMEYMQVEHPHNEKELWKMKHATPARIGIGRCGARYTTCLLYTSFFPIVSRQSISAASRGIKPLARTRAPSMTMLMRE